MCHTMHFASYACSVACRHANKSNQMRIMNASIQIRSAWIWHRTLKTEYRRIKPNEKTSEALSLRKLKITNQNTMKFLFNKL